MQIVFSVNMLINISDSSGVYTYRILRIDPEGVLTLININDPSAFPISQNASIILEGFEDGAISIEPNDPYRVGIPEGEIPAKYIKIRDAAWELIKPLVGNKKNPDIFDRKKRGALVEGLHRKAGRRKSLIYFYLKRYGRGGQTKNSLLPYWDKCGGPGKIRYCGEKKRGRPSILGQSDSNEIGTNVDEVMRGRILIGGKSFYERQKRSLKDAWKFTLKRFYMIKVITEDSFEYKLVDRYPSYSEFHYWYFKLRDYESSIYNHDGELKVAKEYRPLIGRSTDISFGPGSVFQIDATLGDIYLVSVFDRTKVIGKPVVYLIVDVFSYEIVGLYVGIDTMSKVSAMLALENMLSNKVVFCNRYGIKISESAWSCQHKPEIILADRAELVGYYGNDLANSGLNISNTASYRADMKGLVEFCFNLLNIRTIHDIPGSTDKPHQRGERDPRLDATLNIFEFTRILINTVLYLNRRHLDNYPVNSDMILQNVNLSPHSIWDWGLKHRQGNLTYLDETQRKLLLYPRVDATVTDRGLRYKNHHYYDPAIHSLLLKSRREGSWREQIAYHPRITNMIYLISRDKKNLLELYRTDNQDDDIFNQATFEDIDIYNDQRKIDKAKADKDDLGDWAALKESNGSIIKKAKDEKSKLKGRSISKSQMTKDINLNRKYEQDLLNNQLSSSKIKTQEPEDVDIEDNTYVGSVIDINQWN